MKRRYAPGGIVRGPGVRVFSAEMDPGYVPPSTSMNPDARVPKWRHPLFQDPNYEWIEVPEIGKPGMDYVRGQCRHLEPVPVESVLGELVAWLCPECDQQLPAEWRSA